MTPSKVSPYVFDLVGSAASAALGNAANIFTTLSTNRANERMQQRQNAWNLAQWERNNEYNTPAAQMQRLKEAGLNADLMYGQNAAGASGNSSAPAPAANPIPKQPFQFHLDPLMFAQIRNLDAQSYKNNMDGKVADIQAQNDEEFSYLQRLADLGISQQQILYLQSEWEKNQKLIDQIDQNILNMKEQWSIFHEQVYTQVAQTNLLIEQGKKEEAARWLYLAQKEGQELNNDQQRIVNQYLPKKLRSEIDLNYSNAKAALSAAKEHEAGADLKEEQSVSEVTNREFTKVNTEYTKANTRRVRQQTQTEKFVTEQQKIKAKYEKANQIFGLIEKGANSLEKLTGAVKNVANSVESVAGAHEKTTRAFKNVAGI